MTDAGLEFRSDKLWETYFDWWKERGTRESVMKTAFVLDRLLQTPTQHYKRHFPMYVFIFFVFELVHTLFFGHRFLFFFSEFKM